MRVLVVVVIGLWSSQAFAQPVNDLTRTARSLARQGRCDALRAIGARVHELDAEYFEVVFSADPAIRGCKQARATGVQALERITEKSPGTAIALSTLAVGAGVGSLAVAAERSGGGQTALVLVGLAGILIGPTLGHVYAGDTWNTGLQIRLASLATTALGVAIVVRFCPPFSQCSNPGAESVGGALAITGAIGLAVGTLYEIVDARGTARRSNERRTRLVPTIGSDSAGASLAGRF